MPAESCENEPPMDGSPDCQCGKGTLDCLIHPSTPESWTAFMRDSLAKTLASLESRVVLAKEPDRGFTAKSCGSLAWYDQSSCSWKTYQQSLVTDWEPYSETWPRWGMTQGGAAYAHPMSERRITETGGSLYALPTPTAAMKAPNKNANTKGPKNLVEVAQGKWNHFWPTPQTRGYTNDGDLMALGKMCGSYQEMSGMAYRAADTKKTQYWPTPAARDHFQANTIDHLLTGNHLGQLANMVKLRETFATPTARDWKGHTMTPAHPTGFTKSLANDVRMFPTPNASDHRDRGNMSMPSIQRRVAIGKQLNLSMVVSPTSGQLNPDWVGWLMGFPIGWANSKVTVTPKSRSKQQQPTDSLGDSDAP